MFRGLPSHVSQYQEKLLLKPELQVKWLQYLNRQSRNNRGFTLIELLVVIIIIGVLAAIALPSLLSQVNKARQSEARQNVGAMNRSQQAYYLENSNSFTVSIADLGIGIKTQTENYIYDIRGQADDTSSETPRYSTMVRNQGRAHQDKLKSYAGIVYTAEQPIDNVNESITLSIMCESVKPSPNQTNPSTIVMRSNGIGECPNDNGGKMKPIK